MNRYEKNKNIINELIGEKLNFEETKKLIIAYTNSEKFRKAYKLTKKNQSKFDKIDYKYTLSELLFYMNKQKKALKIVEEMLEEKLSNKDKNRFSALHEAISSHSIKKSNKIEIYSEEELLILEKHLNKFYGKFDDVMHEISSDGMNIDILVSYPTEKRNYYILSTLGMGAHQMNVPKELKDDNISRCELLVYLPSYWQINSRDERWFFPIRWLKILSRIPRDNNTWFSFYHSIPNNEPFCIDTDLSGMILISPQDVKKNALTCKINENEIVNFYQIFPITKEEMDYKLEYGGVSLFNLMPEVDTVINLRRDSAFTIYEQNLIDTSYTHEIKINKNNFKIDSISACNHIAIYLLFCIKNDMMTTFFYKKYKKQLASLEKMDLREFIIDFLDGDLTYYMLNEKGTRFTKYYYQFNKNNKYPNHIDEYALKYFDGEDTNNFNTEEYLFIPYNEKYIDEILKTIEKNYEIFKKKN